MNINESDVEQKLVLPLLTAEEPLGLGIPMAFLLTKPNIRSLRIDKRQKTRTHFPDYIVQSANVPVAVIEVKPSTDDLEEAYREARLYAAELNGLFPSGINPVKKQLVTNGIDVWFGLTDHTTPILKTQFAELGSSTDAGGKLREFFGWPVLKADASKLAVALQPSNRFKPAKMLGGDISQNQELARNTFGESLTIQHQGLFNPQTWEERVSIVKSAYVPSKNRMRYVDPIDKIIRVAKSRIDLEATEIADSSKPIEVLRILGNPKAIDSQIVLIVGQVGAGKTTFMDFLQVVALPKNLREASIWCRINLNNARLDREQLYDWISEQVTVACQQSTLGIDFETIETIQAVYSVEINRFNKGIGQLLKDDPKAYSASLASLITELQKNKAKEASAHARYCCGQRQKSLIVVFDNCDKTNKEVQLLMFEAARWAQIEFHAVVFLPMREETFENHANEPPLDTVQKNFVFRIEPPLFQKVLINRIQLVMKTLTAEDSRLLRYDLPNGYHVSYPAVDQAYYLTSLVASVFEHDRFVRRMISGLAGANVRKALEMFVEICKSGHVSEDEIFKMRRAEGRYSLPSFLIARVLLRLNRRFYDGRSTYLTNIFSTEKSDLIPQPFTRLAILRWFETRFKNKGTSGVPGYFQLAEAKSNLAPFLDPILVDRELRALVDAKALVTERTNASEIKDQDLVRLAPAGFVLIDALRSVEYLAAVAEDTWFYKKQTAEIVAKAIRDERTHYLPRTSILLAECLLEHLSLQRDKFLHTLNGDENAVEFAQLTDLSNPSNAIAALKVLKQKGNDPWYDVDVRIVKGQEVLGRVCGRAAVGVFVEVEDGVVGLIHNSGLPKNFLTNLDFLEGELLIVRVTKVDPQKHKMKLLVIHTQSLVNVHMPFRV